MTGLRYNPAGILGAASALAGSVDGYNQQKSADMSFINDEANRRAQQAEFAQTNALDAQKLQMAGQLSAQRGQTATNANSGGQSPFTQAIVNAKQLAIQGAGSDLSDDEKSAFSADALDPRTNAVDFQSAIQKRVQQKQNTAAKAQAVQSAQDQIDPEDLPTISGMAADPQFSASHVMQAIQQSAQKKAKKSQTAQDVAAKQSVIQTAQNDKNLTDDDRSAIAPLANDPNTNAQQLQSRVAALRQQNQRSVSMAEGQKLASARSAMSDLRKQANEIKANPMNYDLFNGDQITDPDRVALKKQYDEMNNRANEIRDTMAAQFTHTATNPQTGHKVGRLPSGDWVDPNTLDPIAQ